MPLTRLPSPKDDRKPLDSLETLVWYKPRMGHTFALHVICTKGGTFFVGADWNLYVCRLGFSGSAFQTYRDNAHSHFFSDAVLHGLKDAGYITNKAIVAHKAKIKTDEIEWKRDREVRDFCKAADTLGVTITKTQHRHIIKTHPGRQPTKKRK